jgi:hypothetical protein
VWQADMSNTPAETLAYSSNRWAETMRGVGLGPAWEETAEVWDQLAAEARSLQDRMWQYRGGNLGSQLWLGP